MIRVRPRSVIIRWKKPITGPPGPKAGPPAGIMPPGYADDATNAKKIGAGPTAAPPMNSPSPRPPATNTPCPPCHRSPNCGQPAATHPPTVTHRYRVWLSTSPGLQPRSSGASQPNAIPCRHTVSVHEAAITLHRRLESPGSTNSLLVYLSCPRC